MQTSRANDGTTGDEIWKSDGSEAGTVRVKDIRSDGGSSPSNLTNVNGTLFFRANDGTTGDELWKSDLTEEGTELVRPGLRPIQRLTAVDDLLFFSGDDSVFGSEGC